MPCSALILAAGFGSRLMPLTAERPKVLVEVAGRPLLQGLLEGCATAGLDEAIVVTGHHHDAVAAWLSSRSPPLPTRCLRNEAYERYGNAWSLLMARDAVAGRDFLKLDGDLVLEASILEGLAQAAGSLIALDRRRPVDAEAMKARVDGDRVAALGKWLSPEEAAGESIGVERIAAADAPALFDAIATLVTGDRPDAYYEDAYHARITQGWRLGWQAVDARWAEIDDPADLARAEALFAQNVDGSR